MGDSEHSRMVIASMHMDDSEHSPTDNGEYINMNNRVVLMKRIGQIATILYVALYVALAVVGCQDYTPFWGDERAELKPKSEYFDFSTVKEVSLNVNYGKRGSRALVEVYTEDPSYVAPDGEIYYKDNAVFRAFCDDNGHFGGRMTLPTYVNKVWVSTMRTGVPQMVKAAVNNGAVAVYATGDEGDGDADWGNDDGDGEEEGGDGPFTPSEGVVDPGTPKGYSEKERKEKPFKVIATCVDECTGNEYKIWEAPQGTTKSWGKNPVKLYTITDWAGQRFARVSPVSYMDDNNVPQYITEENGTYYDNQGLIRDDSRVEVSDEAFDLNDIDAIKKFLWNGNTIKSTINHERFITNTRGVNTVIPYTYVDENGVTQDVKGVNVWIRFLFEGARYMNSIGYYYYPTNQPPSSVDEITRYIAIPNASFYGTGSEGRPFRKKFGEEYKVKETYIDSEGKEQERYVHGGYFDDNGGVDGYWSYPRYYVPFNVNQLVQLLYHDENTGKISTEFPPGYTIGYFITSKQATEDSNPIGLTMAIENNFKYSNTVLNSPAVHRFIALNYNKDVVYGVEDSGDNSYDDILFSIETNPAGISNSEDYPTINDDSSGSVSEYKTYAFEDIWPDGGDYDLNDVVIDHHRFIEFDVNNNVTQIADTFRTVQPYNAATYRDAFAIQLPETGHQWENIAVYNRDGKDMFNECYEQETNSIIFTRNAMSDIGETYILVREFDTGKTKLSLENAKLDQTKKDADGNDVLLNILNPYIISQYKDGDHARIEIHLPKHEATKYADPEKIATKDDAYYINKDGRHPFAISIPKGVKSGPEPRYVVSANDEGKVIGEEVYPDFDKWVDSNGTKYQDWYLYYHSSADDKK